MTPDYKTNIEIERKYIIKMPNFPQILTQEKYTKSYILQIYLTSRKGETHRIRRRSYSDRVEFYETTKTRIDAMSVTEIEGEISEEAFARLSHQIADGTKPINKTRHTFIYKGQIFEIDVYPEWQNSAIMETELKSREDRAEIPPFIEIIREVTGDKAYSNAQMSKSFPQEII